MVKHLPTGSQLWSCLGCDLFQIIEQLVQLILSFLSVYLMNLVRDVSCSFITLLGYGTIIR